MWPANLWPDVGTGQNKQNLVLWDASSCSCVRGVERAQSWPVWSEWAKHSWQIAQLEIPFRMYGSDRQCRRLSNLATDTCATAVVFIPHRCSVAQHPATVLKHGRRLQLVLLQVSYGMFAHHAYGISVRHDVSLALGRRTAAAAREFVGQSCDGAGCSSAHALHVLLSVLRLTLRLVTDQCEFGWLLLF